MDPSAIHWHDSEILSAVQDGDSLRMLLMYPLNWQRDLFEERTVLFTDVKSYREHEVPFRGNPTILGVMVTNRADGSTQWRIET